MEGIVASARLEVERCSAVHSVRSMKVGRYGGFGVCAEQVDLIFIVPAPLLVRRASQDKVLYFADEYKEVGDRVRRTRARMHASWTRTTCGLGVHRMTFHFAHML